VHLEFALVAFDEPSKCGLVSSLGGGDGRAVVDPARPLRWAHDCPPQVGVRPAGRSPAALRRLTGEKGSARCIPRI
jgi:hypothetical protein